MSEHGLTEDEARALRASLEKTSGSDLIERVMARKDAWVSRDRRRFDEATAERVELFSRLKLPKGTVTIGKKA
jgi:hypothetical protein